MRLLLDTHTFLWFTRDNPQLSAKARTLIGDPANEVLLSIVSAWEVAIKVSTGKLSLDRAVAPFFEEQMRHNDIRLLPLELRHLAPVATLPFHHRDPFDRLLIAQSLVDAIPLVSADAAFDAYNVTRLW